MSASAATGADRPAFRIRTASRADLPEVLRVQRAGFRRVAAKAGVPDTELPPVVETLEALQRLHDSGVRTFVAVVDDGEAEKVVGTVRAAVRDGGVVEIGRLAVDEDFTRRGIATALMRALEDAHPASPRLELFTGADEEEPLALYARLGYRVYAAEDMGAWSMVRLAKDRPSATAPPAAPLD